MLPYEKVKLVIVGDSGVGKTTVLNHLLQKQSVQPVATIGIDLYVHTHTINNIPVKFQLWDTTGLEGFRSNVLQHLNGTDATILVHDSTEPLEPYISKWIPSIQTHSSSPIFVFHTKGPCEKIHDSSYIDLGTISQDNTIFNTMYTYIKVSRGF